MNPMTDPNQMIMADQQSADIEDETPQGESDEQRMMAELRKKTESENIADGMKEEELTEIGAKCSAGFEADLLSRKKWDKASEEWTKLALQVREEKTYPWIGASNVKYPLLSTAAMQFSARAYPSLIPSNGKIVNAVVVGKDPTGEKKERANRVSTYMSYQILEEMDGWEEDMDKLLITVPIIGMAFKKTFFDPSKEKNVSKLILPSNLVVNYWATSLEETERISEIILMNKREVKSRQLAGIFLDVELGDPQNDNPAPNGVVDETTPYEIIEQHRYLDLDDDDLAEPYIVTFERKSKKVLRITARFTVDGVELNDKGKISRIDPLHYYTKYPFVPNPDGSFYDLGFGILLGPINESINTLINQLVDAGHLANLQAGFLGKGLKLKMGEHKFKPGEWKTINSTADDLKKQILPLPTKEPSNVLFQLMGTLITSGKELASVAEIFVGKMPGQNTPATTTMATIEQGMKVFTAVYKRIFRSLKEEFKKLYELNRVYLEPEEYIEVLDQPVTLEDFNSEGYDICPGADPNAISQTEKLMKAQGLLELLPIGILDPIKVISRVLEAQEQPNWQELFIQQVQQTGQMPPPPPDPKLQEMQMKSQLEQQKVGMKAQETQRKMELEARGKQMEMAMKAQEHQMDMAHKADMAKLDAAEKLHMQRIFSAQEMQKMAMAGQQHEQNMQLMKEKAAFQQKQSKQTGGTTPARRKSSKPSKSGSKS